MKKFFKEEEQPIVPISIVGWVNEGKDWITGFSTMQIIGEFDKSYLDGEFCEDLFPALLNNSICILSFLSTIQVWVHSLWQIFSIL